MKILDLTGEKFGRLTVIRRGPDHILPSGKHIVQWYCQCDCGNPNLILVYTDNLRRKNTESCGCLNKEKISNAQKEYNLYDLTRDFGIGYTKKGEEFWFDLEDYEKIKDYCWYYDKNGYVTTNCYQNHTQIRLHRLVLGVEDNNKNIVVDHKNHPPRTEHKIDNRKQNLEIVTRSQNNMNRYKQINNTSGLTGVYWNKNASKWQAYIWYENQYVYLGLYDNKNDAIEARKNAEKEYFKEYRFDVRNLEYIKED